MDLTVNTVCFGTRVLLTDGILTWTVTGENLTFEMLERAQKTWTWKN